MQPQLNQKQLDLLKNFAADAAGDASVMFSKWLKSEVKLKMQNISVLPFEQIMVNFSGRNEKAVGLYMILEQGIEGSVLFLFNETQAYNLVDLLIRQPLGTTTKLDDLASSALNETANIVGCAYLNSLQKNLNVVVKPSPPVLMHDLTLSIMESTVMQQAMMQEESLFAEVDFCHQKLNLRFDFFFLPLFSSIEPYL